MVKELRNRQQLSDKQTLVKTAKNRNYERSFECFVKDRFSSFSLSCYLQSVLSLPIQRQTPFSLSVSIPLSLLPRFTLAHACARDVAIPSASPLIGFRRSGRQRAVRHPFLTEPLSRSQIDNPRSAKKGGCSPQHHRQPSKLQHPSNLIREIP